MKQDDTNEEEYEIVERVGRVHTGSGLLYYIDIRCNVKLSYYYDPSSQNFGVRRNTPNMK